MNTTTSIYINNKYNTWYHNIIATAQSQCRVKNNGTYYENHHIIPKSLCGSNSIENLVLLTAREHFICHALLVRFTIGTDKHKMVYAFNAMILSNSKEKSYLTSRLFEYNKIKLTKIHAKNMKGNKNALGYKHTKITKEKIKNANIGKYLGKDNPNWKNYYHTPWGIFITLQEIVNFHNLISNSALCNWFNNPDKIICYRSVSHSPYLKSLPESPLGKTFRELGFWILFN